MISAVSRGVNRLRPVETLNDHPKSRKISVGSSRITTTAEKNSAEGVTDAR